MPAASSQNCRGRVLRSAITRLMTAAGTGRPPSGRLVRAPCYPSGGRRASAAAAAAGRALPPRFVRPPSGKLTDNQSLGGAQHGREARTVERVITPQPVIEGAGVRLKRSIATPTLDYVDPFLLFDHFGSDDPERLPRRLPVAPAPRHRDGDLHAGRRGRPPRQHRQRRRDRRRRRAVDDRRRRHHARGDAAGRRGPAHGRLPALGEPAGGAQDVAAALPGRERGADPRGTARRRHGDPRRRRRGRRRAAAR